jgi:hypothetical protein
MRLQEINHAIKLTIEQAGSKDERIKILFTARGQESKISSVVLSGLCWLYTQQIFNLTPSRYDKQYFSIRHLTEIICQLYVLFRLVTFLTVLS